MANLDLVLDYFASFQRTDYSISHLTHSNYLTRFNRDNPIKVTKDQVFSNLVIACMYLNWTKTLFILWSDTKYKKSDWLEVLEFINFVFYYLNNKRRNQYDFFLTKYIVDNRSCQQYKYNNNFKLKVNIKGLYW